MNSKPSPNQNSPLPAQHPDKRRDDAAACNASSAGIARASFRSQRSIFTAVHGSFSKKGSASRDPICWHRGWKSETVFGNVAFDVSARSLAAGHPLYRSKDRYARTLGKMPKPQKGFMRVGLPRRTPDVYRLFVRSSPRSSRALRTLLKLLRNARLLRQAIDFLPSFFTSSSIR